MVTSEGAFAPKLLDNSIVAWGKEDCGRDFSAV